MTAVSALFSIIIPTRDRPALVVRAVESVLAQSVSSIECLVVDDGSVNPFDLPADERVRLVRRSQSGGPAAARNTGAEAARGTYVAFLDDDDWWLPNRLELACESLAEAPIGVCWSRYEDEVPEPKRRLDGMVHDTILDAVTPHLGGTAIQRDAFVPFDEAFIAAEDVDWWLRVTAELTVATAPAFGCVLGRRDPSLPPPQRWRSNQQLIETHADYFASHRRAGAFRWQRVGHAARLAGESSVERHAFAKSLSTRPSLPAAVHLARALARSLS